MPDTQDWPTTLPVAHKIMSGYEREMDRQAAVIRAQSEVIEALKDRHEAITSAIFDLDEDDNSFDVTPLNERVNTAYARLEEVQNAQL